jgi:hypothetical protein
MYRSRMHPIHRWRRQNSMMINQIIINYPAAHLQPIAGLHHPRYNNIQQQLNLKYQERHRSIYYIQSLPPWRALFALPSWRTELIQSWDVGLIICGTTVVWNWLRFLFRLRSLLASCAVLNCVSSLMPLRMSLLLPVAPCEVLLGLKPAVSKGNGQIKELILLSCHKFQKLYRHQFHADLWQTNHFIYSNLSGKLHYIKLPWKL